MKNFYKIDSFHDLQQFPVSFFSRYLKKNNEKLEVGEPICEIRIGKYNSFFRHEVKIIYSPANGFLEYTQNIDTLLKNGDNIFTISSEVAKNDDLEYGETFVHQFLGESLVYTFDKWFKNSNSYVKAGEAIYSYSSVKFRGQIQYAERSGKLCFKKLNIPFLQRNQYLYEIQYSGFFDVVLETTIEKCYVYLMKDLINGYYKIGISNNPKYREKTLQSEKPMIELIIAKEFPLRIIAESFERALHKSFENQRIRGEWFNLTLEEAENIIKSLK